MGVGFGVKEINGGLSFTLLFPQPTLSQYLFSFFGVFLFLARIFVITGVWFL